MQDLLKRLYKTRLALLAALLVLAGSALMISANWSAHTSLWTLLLRLRPELGSGFLITGLFTVAWQYFSGAVADEHTMDLFETAMTRKAPAIRDAVIQGFAFDAKDLARVASPATMDKIAENTLALQLGDQQLAADVYTDLRQQVIHSPERRHDCAVSVDLAPWDGAPASGDDAMFVATVRYEYRVVPTRPILRFSCVSDPAEYRELLQDPTSALAWYFKPAGSLHGGSDEAFELLQFTVDGKALPVRRTKRTRGQTFTVNLENAKEEVRALPSSSPREVTIVYTYKVLVRRHGHLLYLNVGALTKGFKIAFRYGGCGIRDVNTLDFIASAEPARLSQTPASVPTPAVEVGFDGWVLSRSGVTFVWVLEAEMTVPDTDGYAPARP